MLKIEGIESLLWYKYLKKLLLIVRLTRLDIKIFVRYEKKELEDQEKKFYKKIKIKSE
jgi:hypothetical protein